MCFWCVCRVSGKANEEAPLYDMNTHSTRPSRTLWNASKQGKKRDLMTGPRPGLLLLGLSLSANAKRPPSPSPPCSFGPSAICNRVPLAPSPVHLDLAAKASFRKPTTTTVLYVPDEYLLLRDDDVSDKRRASIMVWYIYVYGVLFMWNGSLWMCNASEPGGNALSIHTWWNRARWFNAGFINLWKCAIVWVIARAQFKSMRNVDVPTTRSVFICPFTIVCCTILGAFTSKVD